MRLEYLLSRAEIDRLVILQIFFNGIRRNREGGYVGVFEQVSDNEWDIVFWQQEEIESRSSAWLEHYTDNVGVSSSNLLGTTEGSSFRGISSAG